jgi:hypothetical protein
MAKRLKAKKKRNPRWGLKGISPENWSFDDWYWGEPTRPLELSKRANEQWKEEIGEALEDLIECGLRKVHQVVWDEAAEGGARVLLEVLARSRAHIDVREEIDGSDITFEVRFGPFEIVVKRSQLRDETAGSYDDGETIEARFFGGRRLVRLIPDWWGDNEALHEALDTLNLLASEPKTTTDGPRE